MNVDKFGSSEFFEGGGFGGYENPLTSLKQSLLINNEEIDDKLRFLETRQHILENESKTRVKSFDERIRTNKNSVIELKVLLDDISAKFDENRKLLTTLVSTFEAIKAKYERNLKFFEKSRELYKKAMEIGGGKSLLQAVDDIMRNITP